MKWENCDINLVEQANIPKFSKIEKNGTPLRLFGLLIDDALVDMIVSCNKLYDHIEKADTSLKLLMKHFAYYHVCHSLVDAICLQTVKCIRRRPSILLARNVKFIPS